MRAMLERIERVNPIVNAFCTLTAEQALAAAREAEHAVTSGAALGPLHGVPYSIKDLNFTKGVRTMGGSFIFEHRVPEADAAFIPRLRKAGGIFVGKTTSPEFGWKALGDSPLTAQPVEHGHDDGRLERRGGGRGRGGPRPVAPGLRRRRLDPDPVELLRHLRPQAVVRAGADVAGLQQRLFIAQRPDDADGRRRGADALGHGRPR
jgi:hypothetical protein